MCLLQCEAGRVTQSAEGDTDVTPTRQSVTCETPEHIHTHNCSTQAGLTRATSPRHSLTRAGLAFLLLIKGATFAQTPGPLHSQFLPLGTLSFWMARVLTSLISLFNVTSLDKSYLRPGSYTAACSPECP